MKLSEILFWEKKDADNTHGVEINENRSWNSALASCDREIDREALHGIIAQAKFDGDTSYEITEKVISTMPTWLRKGVRNEKI